MISTLKLRSSQAILVSMIVLLCLNYGVLDSALALKGSYPGINGKIAFYNNDPDPPYDTEIFVMDNDGTNIEQLTHNDVSDRDPCWSPDGTKIAFEHGDEIWIMDADGSNEFDLTPGLPDAGEPDYQRLEPEPTPVGGITGPINKLEILTPYLALAGLIAVSTVYIIKKRRD